jgi:very-short-patch-repair endonuclease
MLISGTRDERINAIAARQRARVARHQLAAAGIPQSTITRLVRSGRLRRQHSGVFAVGPDAPIPLADETAALLAVRSGAALSHHTAAILWGLRGPDSGDGFIHVTVPGASADDPDGVRVHRSILLQRGDIRLRQRLPLTSPARTLLDLAPLLNQRELERALDHYLVDRLGELSHIGALLARSGRHAGRAILAELLAGGHTTTFTRSEAEELFLDLIRRSQLKQPRVNVKHAGYEIDFFWPDEGVAVEIDGFAFHHTQQRFENDRRRDAKLRRRGITVIRITWRRLTREPWAVIADVAQALAPTAR